MCVCVCVCVCVCMCVCVCVCVCVVLVCNIVFLRILCTYVQYIHTVVLKRKLPLRQYVHMFYTRLPKIVTFGGAVGGEGEGIQTL